MKDIYKMMNEINIDTSKYKEIEVSEFEKSRVKNELKNRIKKTKQNKWKKALVVACMTISLTTTAFIGLSFSTYAREIPLIGNIIQFFNPEGVYNYYEEHSKGLNLTQKSNGIQITVNDAIFDGRSVVLTYTIETEKEISADAYMDGPPIYEHPYYKEGVFMGETQHLTKIDENTYMGFMTSSHFEQDDLSNISVNWSVNGIHPNGLIEEEEPIKGNWTFHFDLKAENSKQLMVDKSVEKDKITTKINQITFSPMSFLIYYDQIVSDEIRNEWDSVSVGIKVKDDLGNVYDQKHNGGYGGLYSDKYNYIISNTFGKLDSKATKLIITPMVYLCDYETIGYTQKGKPIKANYRLKNSKADEKEFNLDDIIIDLKK